MDQSSNPISGPPEPPEPPRQPTSPALPAYPLSPDSAANSYGQSEPSASTSGFAIASLVLGICGAVLLSIIFGAAALNRIKHRGQKGRGMAIAGIVVSCVWIVVVVVVLGLKFLGSADRSPAGQITSQGTSSPLDLRVGDCFNNPSASVTANNTPVGSVEAMPCSSPHNAQIFARFNLNRGWSTPYPGDSAVQSQAESGCNFRFGSISKNKVTDSMSLSFFMPSTALWNNDERAVSCMIINPTATLKTSLLKG